MDDALIRFRQAADRENRRRPVRRRYSSELQKRAVAYCEQRRGKEGVRTIAAALGVSVTSLQRWLRRSPQVRRPRFRSIEIIQPPPSPETGTSVAIQITVAGPRVEGLTVEMAARLLTLLR